MWRSLDKPVAYGKPTTEATAMDVKLVNLAEEIAVERRITLGDEDE